jgi:hypothetical protein
VAAELGTLICDAELGGKMCGTEVTTLLPVTHTHTSSHAQRP